MKTCPRCSELFGDDAAFCPQDGASLERSKDRFLGRTIAARYRLIRRLGSGGMSVVYLARHELIARLSAIKILRPELSLLTEHRERFLREARAVNRINHANIVEITDVGESDGVAYLVMEFVEGESMLASIQRGRLSWPRACRIGMQVASALARAHQMGVIHRDLKPENILLVKRDAHDNESEHVKLTDFGIAKLTGEPSLTLNEQLFGTPGYIAPEYVGGIGIDGRSDIYSLAVVLYEMVTGVLPFDGKGQSELLLKPLTSDPIPVSQRTSGIPAELETLLMRCLARDPAARPHDAFAVHDALADIVRRLSDRASSLPTRESLAPDGSRASREPLETIVDQVQQSAGGSRPESVPQGAASGGASARWPLALGELETHILTAQNRGGAHARAAARAAELAMLAREMAPRVERASHWASELQGKVDRLEARGREFRSNLGYAIDVLVHDRSRERAHIDALKARRQALERSLSAPARDAGPVSMPSSQSTTAVLPPTSSSNDSRAWEIEALVAEETRAARVDDDLAFQLDALQRQLDAKNEELERELVMATGQLEGALSALRHLTSEAARTVEDGMEQLQRRA